MYDFQLFCVKLTMKCISTYLCFTQSNSEVVNVSDMHRPC